MPMFLKPLVQSFVVCDEIYDTRQTKFLLLNPFNTSTCIRFPATIRIAVYADLTDARGRYSLSLQLVDDEEETVWSHECASVLEELNPLTPHRVIMRDIGLTYPKPGRFDLVFLANGRRWCIMLFGHAIPDYGRISRTAISATVCPSTTRGTLSPTTKQSQRA